MPAHFKSVTNASSSSGAVSASFSGAGSLTPGSLLLIAVGTDSATNTVTGISIASNNTGSFVKLTSQVSAAGNLELWLGYNFGNATGNHLVSIARTAGSVRGVATFHLLEVGGDLTAAPTVTASTGSTGTGTSADPGTVTPAVDDLMFTAVLIKSISADSTSRTSSGNTYLNQYGFESFSVRVESAWCNASAAAASKLVSTLGASAEYATRQAMWTPGTSTAVAALTPKGLDTAAADAASAF